MTKNLTINVGKYLAETMSLNAAEHGARLLLEMNLMQAGNVVDDDETLAMITRTSAMEWAKIREKISDFFLVDGGFWKYKISEKKVFKQKKEVDFLDEIKKSPAYAGIDVENELAKMDVWLLTKPQRKKTRRFVVAWLNRIEKPMGAKNGAYSNKTRNDLEQFARASDRIRKIRDAERSAESRPAVVVDGENGGEGFGDLEF